MTWSNTGNHFTTILLLSLLLNVLVAFKRENGTLWLDLQIIAGFVKTEAGARFYSVDHLAQKCRRPRAPAENENAGRLRNWR